MSEEMAPNRRFLSSNRAWSTAALALAASCCSGVRLDAAGVVDVVVVVVAAPNRLARMAALDSSEGVVYNKIIRQSLFSLML